jgi:RNA polymerase sigma-70 factor (ECF subfamily)
VSPHAEDELALVRRAADDPEAFGELYSRHVRRIYSYIFYRTGDQHEAEDLTARVFQRALRHVGRYTDKGVPFSAWLYRIAHNLVANWHRDRSRRPVVALDEHIVATGSGSHPESMAMDSEERDMLMASVRLLPDDRQQLLILKFVEHLSNAEIGQIMGKTEGAVKSLYHRTLSSLREELVAAREGGQAASSQDPLHIDVSRDPSEP